MSALLENIAWIRSGKIGCTFATALSKKPEKIGWNFCQWFPDFDLMSAQKNSFIISIVFPELTQSEVRQIAIEKLEMYIESIDGMHDGLRIKIGESVSWVQYFGPDSHVKTRQSPHPMLSFTNKLPAHIYAKTMAKGILHLAHASIEFLTTKAANRFWETSHKRTKQIIGHELGISEAAKTTWKKS